jgi:hypothetical protein
LQLIGSGSGCIKPNLVAPGLFSLVHGGICPFKKVGFAVGIIMKQQSHTDARRAVMFHGNHRFAWTVQ